MMFSWTLSATIYFKGKVHFTHLWFGPFTLYLPVISNLTLYPPEVLFFNIRYLLLTAINSKQKKIKQKKKSRLPLFFFSLSHSP